MRPSIGPGSDLDSFTVGTALASRRLSRRSRSARTPSTNINSNAIVSPLITPIRGVSSMMVQKEAPETNGSTALSATTYDSLLSVSGETPGSSPLNEVVGAVTASSTAGESRCACVVGTGTVVGVVVVGVVVVVVAERSAGYVVLSTTNTCRAAVCLPELS